MSQTKFIFFVGGSQVEDVAQMQMDFNFHSTAKVTTDEDSAKRFFVKLVETNAHVICEMYKLVQVSSPQPARLYDVDLKPIENTAPF